MSAKRSVVALFGILLAPSARGQAEIWHVDNTYFADRAVVVGDLNSDGVRDVVISSTSTYDSSGHFDGKGMVRGLDGRTGATLFDRRGKKSGNDLGLQLGALRDDLDGDGVKEFVASEAGKTKVFSGRTQQVLTVVPDEGPIVSVGDLDGDGVRDLLIGGGYGALTTGLKIYSSRSAALLRTIPPRVAGDRSFGDVVVDLDDVDGDGSDDLAVNEQIFPGPGRVYVISVSGRQLGVIVGTLPYAGYFGERVTALEDLDGDGARDFAVSSPTENVGGAKDCGAVHVYSGRTLAEIAHIDGSSRARVDLGPECGDVDGDGVKDFVVGDAEWPVWIHSGRTLAPLVEIAAEMSYGGEIAGGADFDGDGYDDFVWIYHYVWTDDATGYAANGRVAAYRGGRCFLSAVPQTVFVPKGPHAPPTLQPGIGWPPPPRPSPTSTDQSASSIHVAGFAPSSLVTVFVTSVNGQPLHVPLLTDVTDANGTWTQYFPWSPYDDELYELQAVGVDATGNPLASPIETLEFIAG